MEMKFLERIESFFNFELSLNDEELQYWDIFRHDLFLHVVYKIDSQPSKNRKNISTVCRIIYVLLRQLIENGWSFLFKKNKRLVFSCSRYNVDGKFIDVNVRDIYVLNRENFICIETVRGGDNFYNLYRRLCIFFNKYQKISFSEDLLKKINGYFNTSLKTDFFEDIINSYYIGLFYYMRLFKRLKPKSIFYILNGIHKDWINAAKALNIPIIEIQHGEVGVSHPAYHYPVGFNPKHIIAPDYFLVWSEFWKNRINYPGVNVISVGNSYYFTNKFQRRKTLVYDFAIISNSANQPFFDVFLQQLLNTGYVGNICYKLHPEQLFEFTQISSEWKDYSNVDVILSEKSVIDLLKVTNTIFTIHSTVVFQALDMNCRVILYDVNEEYLCHKDIFAHPNLHIISDVESFLEVQKVPVHEVTTRFYEDFNRCKFEEFMASNNL